MLESGQILSYVIALSIAAAIPGPGMTALMACSLRKGALMSFFMLGGLILGDLIYLSFAVFGLALVSQHNTSMIRIITYGAAAYLLWLAWKFWIYQPQTDAASEITHKKEYFSASLSGLSLTLANPKTIAFYLAILPLVIPLTHISFTVLAGVLLPVTACILLFVGAIFIVGALKIKHLLMQQQMQKYLFKSVSLMMLCAAISMVTTM